MYFVALGNSAIWDANEAFYVETPREMIEAHDFINPTFNYLPRFNIFTYDAQRPIRSTLGSNRSDYNKGLLRPFYTFSAQPTLTHITGNHTLRGGYDLRVLRENFASNGNQGGLLSFDGTYVTQGTTTTTGTLFSNNVTTNRQVYGRDVAAFLLGAATGGSIDTSATNYSLQSVYHGFFVHDDFRVTPKLTLNIGLRYELEMGTTERFNRFVNGFDIFTPSPIEAARSFGPMNTPSTPSTAAIASRFAIAARVSTWTSRQVSSCTRLK